MTQRGRTCGYSRDPELNPFVPVAVLRARLARTDAALEQNPKDFYTRLKRLHALAGLAFAEKREREKSGGKQADDHKSGRAPQTSVPDGSLRLHPSGDTSPL